MNCSLASTQKYQAQGWDKLQVPFFKFLVWPRIEHSLSLPALVEYPHQYRPFSQFFIKCHESNNCNVSVKFKSTIKKIKNPTTNNPNSDVAKNMRRLVFQKLSYLTSISKAPYSSV